MMERILIYRLGSLGDTLVALPCFNLIRKSFPNAQFTLLTNRPIAAKAAAIETILGKNRFFSDVIDYPIGTRNPIKLLTLLLKIRSRRFSTMIFLIAARSKKSVSRDLAFFRLCGISRIIGIPETEWDFRVKKLENGLYENESHRLARRMSSLGSIDFCDESFWNLNFTPPECSEAERWIGRFGNDSPILAVSVGTKMQSKDWGAENWTKLLKQLSHSLENWNLLLIGANDEGPLSEKCAAGWTGNVVNLCGKTSPRVGIAILSKCAIFVGHDSGPMHMAACAGIPCVAIFSGRNLPGHWFPRGEDNTVIYHQTECFGCGLEVCEIEKKKCILSIRVDEVESAVMEILQKSGSCNASSNEAGQFYENASKP